MRVTVDRSEELEEAQIGVAGKQDRRVFDKFTGVVEVHVRGDV